MADALDPALRGDVYEGSAWLHRARRLLADPPDSRWHGYLADLAHLEAPLGGLLFGLATEPREWPPSMSSTPPPGGSRGSAAATTTRRGRDGRRRCRYRGERTRLLPGGQRGTGADSCPYTTGGPSHPPSRGSAVEGEPFDLSALGTSSRHLSSARRGAGWVARGGPVRSRDGPVLMGPGSWSIQTRVPGPIELTSLR